MLQILSLPAIFCSALKLITNAYEYDHASIKQMKNTTRHIALEINFVTIKPCRKTVTLIKNTNMHNYTVESHSASNYTQRTSHSSKCTYSSTTKQYKTQ